jgi:hypothetical protein
MVLRVQVDKLREEKRMAKKIAFGSWVFITFLALTVIGSLVSLVPLWLAAVFAVPVALFNITAKETQKTLLAALVLAFGGTTMATYLGIPYIGTYIGSLFTNMGTYLALVGVLVAVKEMILRSRD